MTKLKYTVNKIIAAYYNFMEEFGLGCIGHVHKSEILDMLLAGVKAGLVLLFLFS